MNETEAVKTLSTILADLHNDYTFDMIQVPWMKQLVVGPEATCLEPPEWGYQVCKMAGIFHNWSSYLEVRACTLPYDDPEEPCESFRTYQVGFFWVIVNTSVNTCEYSLTGGNFVYYTFPILYVLVKYRQAIKKCFVRMVVNTWKRRSIFAGFDDGAVKMMCNYPEVPEWWYGLLFLVGIVISIVSVAAFATTTPWWSNFALVGIGFLLTVPWVIIQSVADTGINLGVIWQVLPGVWYPGEPIAQLRLLQYEGAFEQIAADFTADLKYAMYARIQPRAIYRGHCMAQVVNCIIYVAFVDVLLAYANRDDTLCHYDNAHFFVCAYAHSVYSSTISFGALRTKNIFKLYPVLPYCFLIGLWLVGEMVGPNSSVPGGADPRQDKSRDSTNTYVHPAVAIHGMFQWSGNNGLTPQTGGIVAASYFQYYLKRKFSAWRQRYAFLLCGGIAVGVTIVGLIVNLVFSFGAGQGKSLKWWGNTVQQAGVDYELYNDIGAYKRIPEKGYFGLDPQDHPIKW